MACDGNRYNTGNPVCSNDLRDLNDDTIIIDGYVNSGEDTVKDRFGIDRLTLKGIQNKADSAIDGFEQLIDDKIIAQGGVEIAQDWGDSPDKVLSQEFLSSSVYDRCSLEHNGVNSNTSPEFNAEVFKRIIETYGSLSNPLSTYTFKFNKEPIIVPIDISGGIIEINTPQVFLDFGGIQADGFKWFQGSIDIDAKGSYCQGFIRMRAIENFVIDKLHIKNALIDTLVGERSFWGAEYGSNLYGDNDIQGSFNSVRVENVITKSGEASSGLAKPATVFGTTGSNANRNATFNVSCNNAYIKDFYSIDAGGIIVDGDSDAFRLFTGELNVWFGNLITVDVGKRVIKTQNRGCVTIENMDATYSDKFSSEVLNGVIDCQLSRGMRGVVVNIRNMTVKAPFKIGVLNSSGASGHRFNILNMTGDDLRFYSEGSSPTTFSLNNATLNGLDCQVNSGAISLNNCAIEMVGYLWSKRTHINDCVISDITERTSSHAIINAIINESDITTASGGLGISFKSIVDSHITFKDTGRSRPLQSSSDVSFIARSNFTGDYVSAIMSGGNIKGELILTDINTNGIKLASITQGDWDVVIDNCSNNEVTGTGVKSKKEVQYA